MEKILSAAIIATYVVLLAVVAVRSRAAKEFEEFSLAKRALPLALIFASLAAAYVGPGFTIGFAGRGFRSGFFFLGVGLAYSLQNILVGLFIAPRLRALNNCHTLGDVIGQKYDRKCHVLAGVISVGLCAGFASVMAKAGGDVIRDFFGIPHWSGVLIIIAATTLYTSFGGLRASVMTDAFQFSTFAILMPFVLFSILLVYVKGGTAEFARQACAATSHGLSATSPLEIVGLVTAFLLGETLIPPYANRALASETTRASRNCFILAGLFSAFWFTIMVSLGTAARSILPGDTGEDAVLLDVVKSTMPVGGYPLLLVVLMAVIASSLDSLLNAGAVAFAQDIVKPLVALQDKTALRIGRSATVVIALVAAAGATAVNGIINGLLICYAIWAPAILPVLVIGLWIKRPRPLAGILSMSIGSLAAITLWIVFKFIINWKAQLEISRIIIPALAAALVAYFVGHWLDARYSLSGDNLPCGTPDGGESEIER